MRKTDKVYRGKVPGYISWEYIGKDIAKDRMQPRNITLPTIDYINITMLGAVSDEIETFLKHLVEAYKEKMEV